MKTHLLFPAALFCALLIAALATGNSLLLFFAYMTAITIIVCLISVLWAAGTVKVSVQYSEYTVCRGDDTSLVLQVRHRGWIPIAPVLLKIPSANGQYEREIRLKDMPGRTQVLRMPIHAAHVGLYPSGVRSCTIEDLLGIFSKTVYPEETSFELAVLPQVFQTEPLTMAAGDPGSEIMARATEDLNAPSDIRSYQPGDAMKKIHWKLSARKQELIVRKFDEPLLQDVLILTDCSAPGASEDPEREADLKDAVLETAASLYSDLMKTDHPIRLLLSGTHSVEADRTTGISAAFEDIARTAFSVNNRFERILQNESKNLRKVGCVCIISTHMNYAMVDMIIRMHRCGPNVRFYLVTPAPDDPGHIPLISKLRQSGAEVSYVVPDGTEQPEE